MKYSLYKNTYFFLIILFFNNFIFLNKIKCSEIGILGLKYLKEHWDKYINDSTHGQDRQKNIINFFKHYFVGFKSKSQQKTLWEFIEEGSNRIISLKFIKFGNHFNKNFLIGSLGTAIISEYFKKNYFSKLILLSNFIPFINWNVLKINTQKLTSFIINSINKKKIFRDFIIERAAKKLYEIGFPSWSNQNSFGYKIESYVTAQALSLFIDQYLISAFDNNLYITNQNAIKPFDTNQIIQKVKEEKIPFNIIPFEKQK